MYYADFALYSTAVLALAAFLLMAGPRQQWLETVVFVLFGLVSWTAIEYILHRFILHGLQPFKRWHAEHHRRPKALICAPTILSATLLVMLVFVPGLFLAGFWGACALTLGVITGYLVYTITHHAIHHWHTDIAWLKQRKRWHALHHNASGQQGCYGVTSAFWDYVFASAYQTTQKSTYQATLQATNQATIQKNNRKTLHAKNMSSSVQSKTEADFT